MTWQEKVLRWRELPAEEKALRRWKDIPRQVFQSMLFEKEPVSLQELEKAHQQTVGTDPYSR